MEVAEGMAHASPMRRRDHSGSACCAALPPRLGQSACGRPPLPHSSVHCAILQASPSPPLALVSSLGTSSQPWSAFARFCRPSLTVRAASHALQGATRPAMPPQALQAGLWAAVLLRRLHPLSTLTAPPPTPWLLPAAGAQRRQTTVGCTTVGAAAASARKPSPLPRFSEPGCPSGEPQCCQQACPLCSS